MLNKKNIVDSKFFYIFTVLGSCLGLGNIWRFPYLLLNHGGLSFLVVYLIAIIVLLFPLFIMETTIGYYYRSSNSMCWRKDLNNKNGFFIKFVSFSPHLVNIIIGSYFIVIFGWSVFSIFHTFTIAGLRDIPSSIGIDNSSHNFGDFSFILIIIVLILWVILIGLSRIKRTSIAGINVGVNVFKILFIVILLFIILFQHNAGAGIKYFINFKAQTLISIGAWRDAFTQVLLTNSIGLGMIMYFSKVIKKEDSIASDCFAIPILNFSVAVIISLFIYAFLGIAAGDNNLSLSDYINQNQAQLEGPGLVFNLMPMVFSHMGALGCAMAFIFFLMFLSSAFTALLCVITSINVSIKEHHDYIKLSKPQSRVAFGFIWAPIILLSVILCTKMGSNIIGLTDSFLESYWYIFVTAFEVIVFAWIGKNSKNILGVINTGRKKPLNIGFINGWTKYFVFGVLALLWIFIFYNTISSYINHTSSTSDIVTIISVILGIVLLPILFILYNYCLIGYFNKKNLRKEKVMKINGQK